MAIRGAALYALLFIVALIYWPGLNGGFLLDDLENLRPLEDFERGIGGWQEAIWSSESGPLRRPVAMLTFAGNMAFNGPDVWAFKYTNLLLHLLCGVLIAWLAGRLIAILRPSYSPERTWTLAITIAAIWLLAPLLVSTTLYIVQRMTQLAALFSFCGLLAYVVGRQKLDDRPLAGWLFVLSSVLLWMPLAAFSKENGLLLPLLLLTIEIFFFRFAGLRRTKYGLYAFFFVFLALPVFIGVLVVAAKPAILLGGYAHRPFSFSERLMTESRVLFFYAANLLIPQGSGMGLFHDDFVVSKGLITPPITLMAIFGWLTVLALVLTQRRRAWWPLLFGVVFFLAAHLMESTVISLELVFEHRNYLAAFGVFFAIVLALDALAAKMHRPAPIYVMMCFLPVLYGFGTYQRANIWSSWDQILLSAQEAHPNSPRVHVELASLYSITGQLDLALEALEQIKSLRPNAATGASLHRLAAYCNAGDEIPHTAYDMIPTSMPTDDTRVYAIAALRGLNRALYLGQCPRLDAERLAAQVSRWVQPSPDNHPTSDWWDVHYELAQLYYYTGAQAAAIAHLNQATRLVSTRPEAWLLLMRYQIASDDIPAAKKTQSAFQERFPDIDSLSERLTSSFHAISRITASVDREDTAR